MVGEHLLDDVSGVHPPSEAEAGEVCLGTVRLQSSDERVQRLPERPATAARPGVSVQRAQAPPPLVGARTALLP